jgi:hypothetical protein
MLLYRRGCKSSTGPVALRVGLRGRILFTTASSAHSFMQGGCSAATYRVRIPVELGAVIVQRSQGSGGRGGWRARGVVGLDEGTEVVSRVHFPIVSVPNAVGEAWAPTLWSC